MARTRKERKRASARRRVETHDTGGGSNYLRMPDGYSFFQVKPGKYRFDFMCYEVKTGCDEDTGNPFFEKGELAYERTFWIHRDIGPNGDWHLCAAKTFKQPCPVCEFRAKEARNPDADEQLLKELAPKERQLWLPVDLAHPDEKFIWEYSHHLFGKQLDAKIRSGDEEDEYEYFADPETGQTVRVHFEQSDRGKWCEPTDIEFRDRKTQYDAEIVEDQPDLDSLLVATPYEKLKRLFLQTDDVDEDEDADDEDKPARRRKSKAKSSEDDDADEKKAAAKKRLEEYPRAADYSLEEGDQVEYGDEGVCEIVRISRDGTSLTLENEDGDTIRSVGADEVTKPKKSKSKPKPVDNDDDDDDWDDEDDEEPPKKSRSKAKPKPKKEDDDEDDEEPPKKSRSKAKPKSESKEEDEDDDDDWDDWDD